MKKTFLLKSLLAATALCASINGAWASSSTDSAGAIDNTTPFNHEESGVYKDDWVTKDYVLTGNGTYSFNFSCTSSTGTYNGWYLFLGKSGWSVNIWDNYIVYRSADAWYDGWHDNAPGQRTASDTYSGTSRQQDFTNASVSMTVKRSYTKIEVEADVTPTSGDPFKIYMNYFYAGSDDPAADLHITFGVENAYVNVTSYNFEEASDVFPTPTYSNDFSSETGLTIHGSGSFVNDDTDARFGTIFQNAGGKLRTNYLQLPNTLFDNSSDSKEMTIGFWVNKKNATGIYTSATPLFTAYSSSSSTSWPMLRCSLGGLLQLNHNGYCNFDNEQNDKGTNAEDITWINDNNWHYYTVVFTRSYAKVYVDGKVVNSWTVNGGDGQNITGMLENGTDGSGNKYQYFCIGGNQAWDWGIEADQDPAFAFDDFSVYNVALSAEQITQIISDKNFDYTVVAKDGLGNNLKTLASGTYSGTAITVAYPKYILSGTTMYNIPAAKDDYYHVTFTPAADGHVETLTYNGTSVSDVYYYAEGENVMPSIASTSGASTRTSMGAVGRNASGNSSTYTDVITLPAGTWQIGAHFYCGNSTGAHTANIKVGDNVVWTKTYDDKESGSYDDVCESFVLTEPAVLSMAVDGGNATGIDYVYVKGTTTYEVVGAIDCSTGYAGAFNTTPIWINNGETGYYEFINHNSGNGSVWNNWNLFVANESSTNLTILRADNYALVGGGSTTWKEYDDSKLVSDLNGATVKLTVKFSDNKLDVTANIIKADGTEMNPYTYTQSDITESKLKLNVSVDNSWLELQESAIEKDITAAGWATYYGSNALDFSGVEGLTVYTATCDGSTVTLTQVNNIQAETGVVLQGEGATYTIPVIASSETAKGDLVGNVSAATAYNAYGGYDLYMLAMNASNEAQFTKVTSGSIAAGKAFLKLASGAAHTLNVIFDDGTTGVKAIDNGQLTTDNDVYDLSGRKIADGKSVNGKLQRGLYIVGGKKVVIK